MKIEYIKFEKFEKRKVNFFTSIIFQRNKISIIFFCTLRFRWFEVCKYNWESDIYHTKKEYYKFNLVYILITNILLFLLFLEKVIWLIGFGWYCKNNIIIDLSGNSQIICDLLWLAWFNMNQLIQVIILMIMESI